MKDIKKMIKCRVLYLLSINWILDNYVNFDNDLSMLLSSFADNYLEQYQDLFDAIYDFKFVDEKIEFNEQAGWDILLNHYLEYYLNNFDEILSLYDEIGYDNIEKVSKLAELFCKYIYDVYMTDNSKKRKQ